MSVPALQAAYAVLLVSVAAYTVYRIGTRFTARGSFLCLFLVFFGLPHLFYDSVLPEMYVRQLTPLVYWRITVALTLMWAGVIAGMESVRLFAGHRLAAADATAQHWRSEPFVRHRNTDRSISIALWTAIVFLSVMTIYEQPFAKLGAFLSLAGDTDRIAEIRASMGGSKVYLYNLVIASVGPFLSFIAVLRALRRRTATSAFVAALLVVLVALGRIGLLNRSSLPLYLIQLVFVLVLTRTLRLRLRHAVAAIGLTAAFVYPFFYHYVGVGVADFFQIYFWNRALWAPYFGMPNYFVMFPDHIPFAMGRNFTLINQLFYHQADYVPAMFVFAREAGNTQGAYNAMFVAEAWADFGFYGVAIESLVLGASLAVVDIWLFSRGKTIESVAAIVCVLYGLIILASTALQTALFSGGIVLVPALAAAMRSIRLPRIIYRPTADRAVPATP